MMILESGLLFWATRYVHGVSAKETMLTTHGGWQARRSNAGGNSMIKTHRVWSDRVCVSKRWWSVSPL